MNKVVVVKVSYMLEHLDRSAVLLFNIYGSKNQLNRDNQQESLSGRQKTVKQ